MPAYDERPDEVAGEEVGVDVDGYHSCRVTKGLNYCMKGVGLCQVGVWERIQRMRGRAFDSLGHDV